MTGKLIYFPPFVGGTWNLSPCPKIILALGYGYMYNCFCLKNLSPDERWIWMNTQVYFIVGILLAFAGLGFLLSRSIKKHDAKMATMKKKKGKKRYMPEYKRPGK